MNIAIVLLMIETNRQLEQCYCVHVDLGILYLYSCECKYICIGCIYRQSASGVNILSFVYTCEEAIVTPRTHTTLPRGG